MKFLISLALLAMAFAEEVHVAKMDWAPTFTFQLPDIRPAMMNEDILKSIMKQQPVMRDSPVDEESPKVHFVEVAEAPEASIPVPEPVNIGQAPLPIVILEPVMPDVAADVPVLEDGEITVPEPVKVAEAPEPAFEEAIIAPEAVRIADAPLPVFEEAKNTAPEAVKVFEPTPNAEAIRIAIAHIRGKHFDDPRLR